MPLEQEICAFDANREKLLAEHKGEFVLIKGSEIIGIYPTYGDALREGYHRFGEGEFLAQEITGADAINTITRDLFVHA